MLSNNYFEEVKSVFTNFYSANKKLVPKVSVEEQQQEIDNLKRTLKYEKFFFTIDLVDFKIHHTNGVYQWLGYDDTSFDIKKYMEIIHPTHRKAVLSISQAAFRIANQYPLEFMKQKFIITIPLQASNGKYYLVKRALSPFQISENGEVMQYMNEFTLLRELQPFEKHSLNPEFRELNLHRKTFDELLKNLSINQYSELGLSKNERKILRYIAYDLTNISKNISYKDISENIGVSEKSVDTYIRRAKQKVHSHFGEVFETTTQMCLFLRGEGLL